MDSLCKFVILFALFGFFGAGDAVFMNATLSSQNIRNGTSINMTATFDVGSNTLNNIRCGYSPDGSSITTLTTYNIVLKVWNLVSAHSARLTLKSSGNPMLLNISPITFEDEKRTFYCELQYYDGVGTLHTLNSQKTALDNVYSPQILDTAMQSSTSLTEGITATLRCIVTGRPASTITWKYNSAINATNSTTSTTNGYLITVTSLLTIHNPVQSMDGQQITCLASHPYSSPISNVTTLSVDYRPVNTTLRISAQNPKLNQIIQLTCNAIGKPAVSMYRFYVNDTSIGNSTSGFLSINASDCFKFNGYFKCVPENLKGQGEIKQQLIVVTDDVKTSVASASVTYNETTNATLSCTVSGCPIPTVSWSKNGVSLNKYGNSLALTSLTKSDAGQYSCHAQNAYTNSSSQIQVTVNYIPVETNFSATSIKPLVNTSVTFTCTSDAVPAAKYRFHRIDTTGEHLVSSSGSESNGILVVSSIMYTSNVYNITYKCVPYNMLGNGLEKKIMLDIQEPTNITQFAITPSTVNESGNAIVECIATGNPAPNLTITDPNDASVSHTNGRGVLSNVNRNHAGSYTCRASNGIGSPLNATSSLVVNYIPEITSLRAIPNKTYSGRNSAITCMARGVPTPQYKFYHSNGTLLQDSPAFLYPSTLRYEDYPDYKATFKCVPYNMMGEGAAQNVTVEILVPPRLTFTITPQTINETQSATLSCVVTAANPSANITLRSPTNESIPHTSGTAVLTNRTRNDAGIYSCVADNGLDGSPVTITSTLTVNHVPDKVELNATNVTPLTGTSVTLTCVARASPAANYRFISVNGSNETTVQDNASATYRTPSLDYNNYNNYKAIYRCMPYNMLGDGPAQNITLDIQVPPMISFSITPSTVNETQNATAECKVNAANPPPTITITDKSNKVVAHTGGQARLVHLTGNEAGTYTCNATNGVGAAVIATAVLIVNHTPDQVKLTATNTTPITGSSVTLNCSARAKPAANRFKFVKIKGSRTTVQDGPSSTFTVAAINYENFDNYKAVYECTAYNMMGEGSTKNITLDIQVSPKIIVSSAMTVTEGERAVLECNVTASNPSATVTWRSPTNAVIPHTNGRALLSSIKRNQNGLYTCQASNRIGSATNTSRLTVNYGPEFSDNSTEVEECIGDNVQLICNAVGRPIPIVKLFLNGNQVKSDSGNLSYNIPQLAKDQFGKYACVANNTVKSVNITMEIKKKPSGMVDDIKAIAKEASIEVTWKLPSCSKNIEQIRVEYRKKGETKWQSKTANPTDEKMTITGLEDNAEYEVQVVAVDINGISHSRKALETPKTKKPEDKDNAPLIAGIIGGVVFFLIVVVVCYAFAKKRRHSSSAEDGIGYTNTATYSDSDKNKNSNIEMKGVKVDDSHYKGPDGSVYASIKKEKAGDANGAIDNANFVADSDGAYEPVANDTPKKKEEGNYAELGTFQSPNATNDKPKEKPKTEYATLEELGPLREFKEPENPAVEDTQTHKITVEPESNEDSAPGNDETDKASDTCAPAAVPVVDDGGNSANVDMI